ncbi:MAG: helix-turn-helix transcriptional regulator, partial [Holophagales bacterium]|nr:helix-turn-helix transcriptional regulator [Holophagales bacterium]
MPGANASTRLRLVGKARRPAAFHEALAAEEGLRKAKGERTRVRLMASGCELLQTTNVDSLMISRVSSQAKVAKGAFYIYFDSRSAFLEELCREYVAYEMSTFPELDLDMDAYE